MGAYPTRMYAFDASHHKKLPLTAAQVPELRIYRVWEQPVGPHPVGMFEVNIFTPAQFGAFVPWLVIHRGPLSVLLHPNTDDELRDHTQRASWLGTPWPLNLRVFKPKEEVKEAPKIPEEAIDYGDEDPSPQKDSPSRSRRGTSETKRRTSISGKSHFSSRMG